MSNARKVVIVGGVAGGASCAARARRLSEDSEIVVFERGPFISFANCGLPYHVGGEIADRQKLILRTPEQLKATLNLDVRTRHEVVSIDREARTVEVRNLGSGETFHESYDALVLAPGASPLRPPIPGMDQPGHFTLRTIPDMDSIIGWIEYHKATRAVVIGGGYIGLEMAEQLAHRGLDTTVVEMLPQVMAPLDPEMAGWLHAEMESHGMHLKLGARLLRFEPSTDAEPAAASVAVLEDGTRLPADIVILGLGVRPETSLAVGAGLDLGPRGGIRVDAHMRTSDPNIYAVGDAVEVPYLPLGGAPALVPLAGPANRQGRIAADNIFGGDSTFRGVIGTAILKMFDLAAGCTGANAKQLRAAGVPFEQVHLHPGHHVGYYPGAESIALKILFDPTTGRLLGAQAVGRAGVDKRIDVLATALRFGATVDDLAELELAYAPPFGAAKDPVNLAGMIAQNIRRGMGALAQWSEIPAEGLDPAGAAVLLDVRDPAERQRGAVPGSLHIPLAELRGRLNELPRDKEIIVHCASGQRSNNAMRVLLQRGFRARNLTGSYRTWQMARR